LQFAGFLLDALADGRTSKHQSLLVDIAFVFVTACLGAFTGSLLADVPHFSRIVCTLSPSLLSALVLVFLSIPDRRKEIFDALVSFIDVVNRDK
jgi:hypothetical protein